VKQYKKIFELDGVVLEFVDDTLKEIAHQALKRNTGARGLRAILEDAMLDVMFDMPSRSDIIRCVVTKEVITNRQEPLLITSEKKKRKKKEETA
jgi:ATP-dependent Clp protease ATP-binding subunit ClpX